jgi:hypothetical protein
MKKVLILNALIWAGVILVASTLVGDHPKYQILIGILAVGFTLQNGFTYAFLKDHGPSQ